MTRSPTRLLLALAAALSCVAFAGACGGSDAPPQSASAQELLRQTFGAGAKAIDRGRVTANLRLEPEGLLKLGGPIAVRLSGPFTAPAARDLPQFDLAFLGTLAGQQFRGSALSTGRRAFVTLDDRAYALADDFVAGLRKRSGDANAKRKRGGLQALGLDPSRWISDPERKGSARVGAVQTDRIGGDVKVERLLADLGTLLDRTGGGGGSLLTPKLRSQVAAGVKSAKVDVWSGASDHIMRQLAVAVTFAFKQGQSPIPGLDGGRLTLRARLDDVNGAPVRITAPQDARPLSELTGAGGLGSFFGGIGEGLTGGIGPGQAGAALLRCLTQAGGSSADAVRCVSKLAP